MWFILIYFSKGKCALLTRQACQVVHSELPQCCRSSQFFFVLGKEGCPQFLYFAWHAWLVMQAPYKASMAESYQLPCRACSQGGSGRSSCYKGQALQRLRNHFVAGSPYSAYRIIYVSNRWTRLLGALSHSSQAEEFLKSERALGAI